MSTVANFKIDVGINSRDISRYRSMTVAHTQIEQLVDEENEGTIIEEKNTTYTETFHSEFFYDTIAQREVQCLIPQTMGKGTTAVFFPAIESENTPAISFVAFNLNAEDQKKFFDVLHTLKFDTAKNN